MKNKHTITIAEANNRSLTSTKFNIGDFVYLNHYGEQYYATFSQWMNVGPLAAGFYSGKYPDNCFLNNNNDWFSEYEVIKDHTTQK